jgi:hypothetical protein
MTRSMLSFLVGLSVAASVSVLSAPASADPVVATGNDRVTTDRITTIGPNRQLLRSGAWTLGLSYVPALVVAIHSNEPADKNLYIPVAGPWMDYAKRDCATCEHETTNKVLLVTDGIFQGIGALQLVGSFLFVETRTTTVVPPGRVAKTPKLQVAPARIAHGYGLAARGTF